MRLDRTGPAIVSCALAITAIVVLSFVVGSTRVADADIRPPPSGIPQPFGVARNIIEGDPVDVCASDYPNAVAHAVAAWNEEMRNEAAIASHKNLFATPQSCSETTESGDIDYVSVEGRSPSDDDFYCGRTALGCLVAPPRSPSPHNALTGRLVVIVNTLHYPKIYDIRDDLTNPAYKSSVRTVAHELGHVLGLGHYECIGDVALMCHADLVRHLPVDRWTHKPQSLDHAFYAGIYNPNTVQQRVLDGRLVDFVANVPPQPGVVVFNFDARNVGVEEKIEIRRWDGSKWDLIAAFDSAVGETAWVVGGQPSGLQTYRIFSTTHAYITNQCYIRDADCDSSNDPSASALGERIGFSEKAIQLTVPRTPMPSPSTYNIVVQVPGGGGKIKATPDGPYATGTRVTLEAVPDTVEYAALTDPITLTRLDDWGGAADGCTAPGRCVVEVNGTTVVTAKFVPIMHSLTIRTPRGVGWSDPPPRVAPYTHAAGSAIPVKAVWNDRTHHFSGWSGCARVTGRTCVVYMQADEAIQAAFVERPVLGNLVLAHVLPDPISLVPGTVDYEALFSGTGSFTTVSARARDITMADVEILPSDHDPLSDGHQVNVPWGQTTDISVTVTLNNLARKYTVSVQRPDVRLSNLTLSEGALSPTFGSETTSYTATVDTATESVTIAATRSASTASVSIDPADADTGTAGHQVSLDPGATTVTVTVTKGGVSRTYTVAVTRPLDVTLSALTVSGADLVPDFDPETTPYTAELDDDLPRTTVTATAASSTASVAITPGDADSDTSGHQVNVPAGTTRTITVTVTNGSDRRTYTVDVERPDPFVLPTLGTFAREGTDLKGRFTWTGDAPQFVQFELHRASTQTGTYTSVATKTATTSPVTFSGQRAGNWYKLRARTCEHVDEAAGGSASSDGNPRLNCSGDWTAFTAAVELPATCTQVVEDSPDGAAASLGGAGTHPCTDDPPELSQTPNSCYTFDRWTFSTSGTTRTATANYTEKQFTQEVEDSPDGAAASLGGRGTYPCTGNPPPVSQTPNSCYTFDRWTFSTSGMTRTATANYTEKQFTQEVEDSPDGAAASLGGRGTYPCTGNPPPVSQTPNSCYTFDRWTFSTSGMTRTATANYTEKQFTQEVEDSPDGAAASLGGGGTYPCTGDPPPVSQTPDACYTFDRWTFNTSGMTRTATANYTKKRYTLTVTGSPSEGGTVSGGGTYDCGSTQTASASASTGYHLLVWNEDTQMALPATSESRTVTMDRNRSVSFGFHKNSYTLSVYASPAEGGEVSGGGSYDHGDTPSVSQEPNDCWTFTGWSGDTTSEMTGARSVTANYEKTQYKLTVTGTPSDGGTVRGGGTYDCGSMKTASASASTGYHLLVWNEEIQAVVRVTSESRTVKMDGNRSVSFIFHKNSYRLSTSASTGGSVSGGGTYLYKTKVEVTASPDDLYYFSHWTGDASGSANPVTVTMTGNKSVHAVFGDVCDIQPGICPRSQDADDESPAGDPEP